MKKAYLITTASAAFLAGTMLVAAQGMQKQGPGGDGGAQGQTQREPNSQPEQKGKQQPGQKEQGKQGTTRQGAGDPKGEPKGEPERRGQQGQSKERQGQSKDNPREGQQGQRERESQPGQNPKGQAREGGGSGSVSLTAEQSNRVRERVLAKGPRASNINFSINVGVVVPRTVRIVEVDPIIIEYYPQYRRHFYFIVEDQIIIVDRNHHIVAVINV